MFAHQSVLCIPLMWLKRGFETFHFNLPWSLEWKNGFVLAQHFVLQSLELQVHECRGKIHWPLISWLLMHWQGNIVPTVNSSILSLISKCCLVYSKVHDLSITCCQRFQMQTNTLILIKRERENSRKYTLHFNTAVDIPCKTNILSLKCLWTTLNFFFFNFQGQYVDYNTFLICKALNGLTDFLL